MFAKTENVTGGWLVTQTGPATHSREQWGESGGGGGGVHSLRSQAGRELDRAEHWCWGDRGAPLWDLSPKMPLDPSHLSLATTQPVLMSHLDHESPPAALPASTSYFNNPFSTWQPE